VTRTLALAALLALAGCGVKAPPRPPLAALDGGPPDGATPDAGVPVGAADAGGVKAAPAVTPSP